MWLEVRKMSGGRNFKDFFHATWLWILEGSMKSSGEIDNLSEGSLEEGQNLHTKMQKLRQSAPNALFSPVRIILLYVTSAALVIFILVRGSFPASVSTFGLNAAPPEECVPQNKVAGTPHKLCGMSEAELQAALALPHGTRKDQDRYYYKGSWRNFENFRALEWADAAEQQLVCVVIHVEEQMPCRDLPGGCVLHFHLRPNDTDVAVMQQLIEWEGMSGLDPSAKYDTILDAGGNCGIASVLFAIQYPNASVVAVEPAQDTYDVLRMNTEQFPNVQTIHAGVWNRESMLVLFGDIGQSWGMQVKEVKAGEEMPPNAITTLDGISIPYIMRLTGLDHFDFLKVDIEGSELQVFDKTDTRTDFAYLKSVQVVVCEIHEHMRAGATNSVMNAFATGFDQTMTGEYVMFTRQKG